MDDEPSTRRGGRTEATRLLCAGTHLDAVFRRRVIDELVGHAERPVAPQFGADVLPVLAHALHARREEVRTALLLLAVWAGFLAADAVMARDALEDAYGGDAGLSLGDVLLLPLRPDGPGPALPFGDVVPGRWAVSYALVALLLWSARTVSGRGTDTAVLRRVTLPAPLAWVRRYFGQLFTAAVWVLALRYWWFALHAVTDTPYPVLFPLLLATVVWRHRSVRQGTLRATLARRAFAAAEQPALPARYARLRERIRREQDASLTLYDVNRPFIGAGTPRKPWSVVLELQPRNQPEKSLAAVPGQRPPGAALLTARQIIDMIEPRLRDLRASAGDGVRDRLRALEVEEFVYLPAGVGRDEPLGPGDGSGAGVYGREQVERHLAEAAGEGGEARRHFLRVRVGAWDEQVVVSLLVRVHTQGGMLVLEVVPHVLGPVVPAFREVDALVEGEPAGPLREAVRALVDGPSAGVSLGVAALGTLRSVLRVWQDRPERAAPDAPAVSLRELASTQELSLFQEMDVTRYIRTLQDRIGEGVRDALHAHGYRTDRLEQHITTIHNSGVYIEEMSGGAVATGTHGQATHTERSTS